LPSGLAAYACTFLHRRAPTCTGAEIGPNGPQMVPGTTPIRREDGMSNVRVVRPDAGRDWRDVEAAMHEAVVDRVDDALETLAELETMLGDADDVGHNCRALAASLRTTRNDHTRRAEMLRTASSLLAAARADDEDRIHPDAPDGWHDR